MLTPVDVQNRVFKGGIGYDKKDVESFMNELISDYGELYRSNVELKDKIATLDESLQHYRSIEESMQKALTLSEKTAEETLDAANDKARQINLEAEKKAEALLEDAKAELQQTKDDIYKLQQQHSKFKEQFTKVLEAQLKIMDGEMVEIDLGPGFEPSHNYDSGGLGSEGGLGGGYVGASSQDSGRERTNQEPAFDRGTLNMDPFADAMNGGGRFSRQTGGAYNGKNKKTKDSKNSTTKPSLNVKSTENSTKVRKNFASNTTSENNTQPTKNVPSNNNVQTESNVSDELKEKEKLNVSDTPKNVDADTINNVQTANVDMADEQLSGDVETKIKESNMLDSEDNHETGFDFISDQDDTYSGEVEDKVNESNMIDSEDNYDDGFDFLVGDEEEIPTISSGLTSDGANEADDVLVGDVEDNVKKSNLIGNDDDDDDGFNFL